VFDIWSSNAEISLLKKALAFTELQPGDDAKIVEALKTVDLSKNNYVLRMPVSCIHSRLWGIATDIVQLFCPELMRGLPCEFPFPKVGLIYQQDFENAAVFNF
jgi:hypothetical protein